MSKEALFAQWERGEWNDEIEHAFGTPHDEYVYGEKVVASPKIEGACIGHKRMCGCMTCEDARMVGVIK